ncbi:MULTISPECIES: cyanide-forming glycine dehydrogenase subunit HcnB [unclassified Pseudomonas]|uniref:cyanide-forming glycine dehydrogenase subunit HcnB n=1 Tax=unclassified Pseudomonas TaxID=196821 RepID=UPI001032C09A|nr:MULTISPECIES: cyanide-forming glycine dehydrogenase subunit HcnB [unclassified Pseudomonas]
MSLRPVIVGGGPAGMAAAIELAKHGVRTTLFEEASRLGGVVYRGPLREGVQMDYLGPRYTQALLKLHQELQVYSDFIEVHLNHRVVGAEGSRLWVLDDEEHLREYKYPQLVLAAGCHERSVPFPGWTLPGVMLLGGLQLQIKSSVVKPQGPVVITGTGPLLPLLACQLLASGVTVAGVFEACSFGKIAKESLAFLNKPQLFLEGLSMLTFLKRHGIPIQYGWGIVAAHGGNELSSVTVAPYTRTWGADLNRTLHIPAQTLAVGYGFIPRTQLSQQMNLRHEFSDDGCLRAVTNIWQQSSEPHVHPVGDMAGIRGGEAAMLTGKIAAVSIMLQRDVLDSELALKLRSYYLTKLEAIVRFRAAIDRYTARGAGQAGLPASGTVICRCENTTRGEIDKALEQGVQDLPSLKMRTRVGMGDCQGRMCVSYCTDRLRETTGRQNVGWLRPRFPTDPIPFSAFKSFDIEDHMP